MGLRLPRWEHLAQVSKKTPSSVPLQTRSSSRELVTGEAMTMTTMKQLGLCMFPLVSRFAFRVKDCSRHSQTPLQAGGCLSHPLQQEAAPGCRGTAPLPSPMSMYQERRGRAVFRDVEVGDVDGQGDMLGTVGATGTDLCREALDPPRWRKAPFQDGLLRGEGSVREPQTLAPPPASMRQVKSSPSSLHPSDRLPSCAQRPRSETDPP